MLCFIFETRVMEVLLEFGTDQASSLFNKDETSFKLSLFTSEEIELFSGSSSFCEICLKLLLVPFLFCFTAFDFLTETLFFPGFIDGVIFVSFLGGSGVTLLSLTNAGFGKLLFLGLYGCLLMSLRSWLMCV